MRTTLRRVTVVLCGLVLLSLGLWFSVQPSNNRLWAENQKTLPYAELENDLAHIHNIRNFTYRTTDDYDIAYYDKTYDLNKIESLWYIVEPFSKFKGAAHTFLSFGFEGPEYVAISIEIRKEEGEKYSFVKGLLKQFEIIYVIGDEPDLIKLRSNYRGDDVYLYPVKASKEKIRELFVDMLQRANDLQNSPEFYNTLANSCTVNIARHINTIAPKSIPFSYKVFLPAYSDRLAYDLGLLDTDLPFEEAREYYRINERALKYANSPDFSLHIRDFET